MTIDTTHTSAGIVSAPSRAGMTPSRRIALWGGLLYLLTFAASFPQLGLFSDLIDDPTGYVTSSGSDTPVQLGAWLEIVTALARVGTAVALYRVIRRVAPRCCCCRPPSPYSAAGRKDHRPLPRSPCRSPSGSSPWAST